MSVVTATIKSEGKTLSPMYELMSIDVHTEVNRIPYAELVLIDGDPAKQEFALSDEAFFEPGKEVEIQLRYEGGKGGNETVFKGLVVRHNLEANALDSLLTVELRDKALAMTMGRHNALFEKKKDSDIIGDLISQSGVTKGDVPSTKATHEEMIQYNCTNWDFMLLRAQANNLLVTVDEGKVDLHDLKISGSAKHQFEYGISNIYRFEMEADASHQYKSVSSVAWDIKTQQLTKKSEAKDFSLAQSDLKGATIAGKLGGDEYSLYNPVPLLPEETSAWADAYMARYRMSMLRGTICVEGFAKVKLMDVLELKGIGKRFNGKTLVTGIRHSVNEDGWQTCLQFGLSPEAFALQPNIAAPDAGGLLSKVSGLQVGLVDAFEEDKEGKEFRVRVQLPGLGKGDTKIWARLAGPDAGIKRGLFFRPEKGDEVVLGFFNNDPRQAVILGAMYSSKNTPPEAWSKLDKENAFKGFVSKTGITFQIDDKEQTLSFLTSEKQSVVMDEKKKSIIIKDLNENTITLSEDGISIKSAKDLQVEAAGDMTIKADGDCNIKASNITLDASGNVDIKGSAVDVK